jgi:hypothetical protein
MLLFTKNEIKKDLDNIKGLGSGSFGSVIIKKIKKIITKCLLILPFNN